MTDRLRVVRVGEEYGLRPKVNNPAFDAGMCVIVLAFVLTKIQVCIIYYNTNDTYRIEA